MAMMNEMEYRTIGKALAIFNQRMSAYLDKYTGSMVCSKQLYKEALNHAFDEPKQWEINEIMNQCISWIFSLIATKATEK